MFKINRKLVPIKVHYFFFMAAMGPILPQITVYGKQLGIPSDVMGLITSVLPILYVLAKPLVGYLADYFTNLRKAIFMSIIVMMTLCYAGFYFVPQPLFHQIPKEEVYNFMLASSDMNHCNFQVLNRSLLCTEYRIVQCSLKYLSSDSETFDNVEGYLKLQQSVILSDQNLSKNPRSIDNKTTRKDEFNYDIHNKNNQLFDLCLTIDQKDMKNVIPEKWNVTCRDDMKQTPDCLYNTSTFWSFVILMCLGTIGFNVANCVSDAICFDVLGDTHEMKYGTQRVWGTIGFGLTALISGIAVDLATEGAIKSFVPAIIVMLIFSLFDLISIRKLKLPKLSSNESIFKDVINLLRQSHIAIFLVFATIAGIIDSFIIYFMFWHLEEVATKTGYEDSMKLIEGCVVAAECLGGEIIFFLISGKILKKIGYIHCLSFCFFTYSIRLYLISVISNPWWLVPIELFMQGASYALCYTCIVAYASAVAPTGTSATVQGLVAGMDDGVGFSIGSLIGGQMYKVFGGAASFKMFSGAAMLTCVAHILLRSSFKLSSSVINKDEYEVPPEQEEKAVGNGTCDRLPVV